jgi:protein ImuA
MKAASSQFGSLPPSRRKILGSLREKIRRLEQGVKGFEEGVRKSKGVPLGLAEIDAALPWGGLPLAGMHEVIADGQGGQAFNGAAMGFVVFLVSRFSQTKGVVLWCRRGDRSSDRLYGPGLSDLGLSPERLVVVRGQSDSDVLWAMEEGLRSPGLVAVLGEVDRISLTGSRRLQLASEAGATAGFLLRPQQKVLAASTVLTRWRIAATRGAGDVPRSAWEVELLRCRYRASGAALRWRVEEDHETGTFRVAADVLHRKMETSARLVG